MIKKATEAIGQNIWIVFVCLAFFLCMDLFGSGSEPDEGEYDRDLTGWETIITPEEYRQIEYGMTYEEVRDIVGGEGKVTYKSSDYANYAWPGKYYEDELTGYVEVDFAPDASNGRTPVVTSIVESNVVDGEECNDTRQKIEQERYSELETPVTTERQKARLHAGMDYGKVCAIMKGEGALYRSIRNKSRGKIETSQAYVWRYKSGSWENTVHVRFENGILTSVY